MKTTRPQSLTGSLGKLEPNLDIIRKMLVEHDMDFLLTIVGRERIGKSNLAVQIAMYVDPDFTVDQIVFDIPSLYEQVYKLKKGQVIIIDEGATTFFAREAMNTDVREGVKLLTVMGERNLLVILCVPSFFIIDKYIRQHRIAGLIKVTKRGRFKFWSRGRLNQSYYNSKANVYAWADANFKEGFPYYQGEVWDRYRERKAEYLSQRRSDWAGKDKYYTAAEFAEEIHMGKYGVLKWIREGKIEAIRNPAGHYRIHESELSRILNGVKNVNGVKSQHGTRDERKGEGS